jgi:hypothetical protein
MSGVTRIRCSPPPRHGKRVRARRPAMKSEAAVLPETAKAVGIWIRVSTEDQVRGESPEHHERRARAYAESTSSTP